jgi:hypothetical protein
MLVLLRLSRNEVGDRSYAAGWQIADLPRGSVGSGVILL